MKFLYLLSSVFRDWFTVRRKFTLSVIIIFFLSSLIMTFSASLLGGEILWTDQEIYLSTLRYEINYPEELPEDERIGVLNSFVRHVSAIEKGNLSGVERSSITAKGFLKTGDKEYEEIFVLPHYENIDNYREFFGNAYLYTNGFDDFLSIYDNYTVTEGRRISAEDCKDSRNTIVVPKRFGFAAGDKAEFCGMEFEVVGVTESPFTELPAVVLEKLADSVTPFNYDSGNMVIRLDCLYYLYGSIQFASPLSEDHRREIESNINLDTGADITFVPSVLPDNGLKAAYLLLEGILGTIIAVFSMLCIYNVSMRLCISTMPMMNMFKLCGMKRGKVSLILAISLFICLVACFGLSCAVIAMTKPLFQSFLNSYVVRGICFITSAVIMTLAALIALLPPIISISKSSIVTDLSKNA